MKSRDVFPPRPVKQGGDRRSESGFTLIETTAALVIILIALLGVFFTFTYAINYNSGNRSRSQALAVLQEETERIRSAKYTPAITDAILTGGVKTPRTVSTPNGRSFRVEMSVDNDPFTSGVQDESVSTALKEISITVTLDAPSPGWQSAVPATIVMRRVRGN